MREFLELYEIFGFTHPKNLLFYTTKKIADLQILEICCFREIFVKKMYNFANIY